MLNKVLSRDKQQTKQGNLGERANERRKKAKTHNLEELDTAEILIKDNRGQNIGTTNLSILAILAPTTLSTLKEDRIRLNFPD